MLQIMNPSGPLILNPFPQRLRFRVTWDAPTRTHGHVLLRALLLYIYTHTDTFEIESKLRKEEALSYSQSLNKRIGTLKLIGTNYPQFDPPRSTITRHFKLASRSVKNFFQL